ncbi:hypothetical protein WR25_13688 [Diploscapter pachys]|uniref:Uncharacterized protein n=1 Tax=Diploscapter pachys TaxID=2018661 RepID=A0A2A2K7J5_9BILA|nr:hypothetical protein WR25_13688 [Diploscapter pachys]
MVRLDRMVHHLFHRMHVERTRRHDDQTQRIGDQIDQRMVGEQARIFAEHRRRLGVLDMRAPAAAPPMMSISCGIASNTGPRAPPVMAKPPNTMPSRTTRPIAGNTVGTPV